MPDYAFREMKISTDKEFETEVYENRTIVIIIRIIIVIDIIIVLIQSP